MSFWIVSPPQEPSQALQAGAIKVCLILRAHMVEGPTNLEPYRSHFLYRNAQDPPEHSSPAQRNSHETGTRTATLLTPSAPTAAQDAKSAKE